MRVEQGRGIGKSVRGWPVVEGGAQSSGIGWAKFTSERARATVEQRGSPKGGKPDLISPNNVSSEIPKILDFWKRKS